MYDPKHYREQAKRGRRLSQKTHDPEISDALSSTAKEFDEVAEDLESGAVEIRHPELMPQSRHAPPREERRLKQR